MKPIRIITTCIFSLCCLGFVYSQQDCTTPNVIASLPFSATGLSTLGTVDDYDMQSICGGTSISSAEDYLFEFTPTFDISIDVRVDITNTPGQKRGLYVTQGCPDLNVCVNQQSGGGTLDSLELNSISLSTGVTYYIIVKGTNELIFDLAISINPVCPINHQPADGSSNVLENTVSWTPENSISSDEYLVHFGEVNPPPFLGSTTDTFMAISTDFGKTYFWKSESVIGSDTSENCSVVSFSTPLSLLCPINPIPADGASEVTATTLSWEPDPASAVADSFMIFFGTTNSPPYFGTTLFNSISVGDLLLDETYYWRVEPYAFGQVKSCSITSFTTPAFLCPVNVSPLDGETNVSPNQLSWNLYPNSQVPDSFKVYFGSQSPPPFFQTTTDNFISISTNPCETYYWKIESVFSDQIISCPEKNFTSNTQNCPIQLAGISNRLKVGNNHESIDSNAVLDLESNDKGILIPRVRLDDLNTKSPLSGNIEEGMLIYNQKGTEAKGFYYWEGEKWQLMVKSKVPIYAQVQGIAGVSITLPEPGIYEISFTVQFYGHSVAPNATRDYYLGGNWLRLRDDYGKLSVGTRVFFYQNYSVNKKLAITGPAPHSGYITYRKIN